MARTFKVFFHALVVLPTSSHRLQSLLTDQPELGRRAPPLPLAWGWGPRCKAGRLLVDPSPIQLSTSGTGSEWFGSEKLSHHWSPLREARCTRGALILFYCSQNQARASRMDEKASPESRCVRLILGLRVKEVPDPQIQV